MKNKILIKERINAVDYNNNNQALLYTSSGADIEGGLINVELESDVAGWHQLTFDIPAIIYQDGKEIENPLMDNLFPLSKLQYTREIRVDNRPKEEILYFIVQPEEDSRDENGILLHSYTAIDYPRHVLSKTKQGITIGDDTLDPVRSLTPNNEIMNVEGKIIYIKAEPQTFTVSNYIDLGSLKDAYPGAFAWVSGTEKGYRLTGVNYEETIPDINETIYKNWTEDVDRITYHLESGIPVADAVWSPEWGGYPLEPDVNNYNYGSGIYNDADKSVENEVISKVQFYWDLVWLNPDRTMGRYDGKLYRKDSRLLYDVYQTIEYDVPARYLGTRFLVEDLQEVTSYEEGCSAYVFETETVWYYSSGWVNSGQDRKEYFGYKEVWSGKWSKLDPIKPYLSPNKPKAYLEYILEGTGWTVGEVDEIWVDNNTFEYAASGVPGHEKQIELTTSVSVDNSNAYNAINEVCEAFKGYARFDHVNKVVSFKAVPGDDNNLIYQYRDNLASTRITQDGEKAVSKLWVYGGEDLNGQVYIEDCNRMNPEYYLFDAVSMADLIERAPNPVEGNYASISVKYTWSQISSVGELDEVQDISDLPVTGQAGQIIYVKDYQSYFTWISDFSGWYDTFYSEDPGKDITFSQRVDYNGTEWVDKGQFYHYYEPVSPYADNYIMNFDYFIDRGLITSEEVDDIKYNYNLPISHLRKKYAPMLTRYTNLNSELLQWENTYDECKIARDAIDKSLRTNYAIYEKDDTQIGSYRLKEQNINAYPPGADIDTQGWVLTTLPYASSEVSMSVATYDNLSQITSPYFGQSVAVIDEGAIYKYYNIFNYDDTICAYLGWTPAQVQAQGFDKRVDVLLTDPQDKLEARIRNEGLFQKLRDEELAKDTQRMAALAPWYNPPANAKMIPTGELGKPTETSLIATYYDTLDRYITEQSNMDNALDNIARVEEEITELEEQMTALMAKIESIQTALREKYGDFIVEGEFTDDTMVWIYNLWYAGLKALDLYHRPLITYELNVVDVSGLPEYRTVTEDVYHDIVYRLNKPELVLPNPGDYCYVTDNKMGLVREKANITSVTRNLSNPSQNKITIATVDTNTEDLIGKLVTAANTIYSKQQIYNRSAIINADGTVATDSLSESLENGSGDLSLSSSSGTVIVGESGITTVDKYDANYRMRYTGKGVFSSTNGGLTWDNILNAGKISTKALSAGTIDSNVISVSNIGHDSSIIIDDKGITALNYNGANSSDSDPDWWASWKNNIASDPNISFFLDSATGNAYFKGYLASGAGTIGGWTLSSTQLSGGSGSSYAAMSSSGTYAFWAGASNASSAPFSVTHAGALKATSATIEGKITVNDPSSTIEMGSVGGWTATGNGLQNTSSSPSLVLSAGGISGTVHGHSDSHWAIYANGNFGVTTGGDLYASNAHIAGDITASSGKIGGWLIDSVQLRKDFTYDNTNYSIELRTDRPAIGDSRGASLLVYDHTHSRYNWYVTPSGYMYARNAAISGTISSSTISSSTINSSTIDVTNGTRHFTASASTLQMSNSDGGFLAMSITTHPYVSALNIAQGSGGIVFKSGKDQTDVGSTYGDIGLTADYGAAALAVHTIAGNNIILVPGDGRNGFAYINSITSSNKIAVSSGGPSSLNVKTDLHNISNDYGNIYKDLQDLNLYTYRYKYKNIREDLETDYGFIIDEILEKSTLKKYFRHYDSSFWVGPGEEDRIATKEWERDAYIKGLFVLIKALQNKIDILEQEIKKEG